MSIQLTSPAFRDGQTIPARYTADGGDASPPLSWSGAPEGARSFALVCEDPDAPRGTFAHWVAYGLPAGARELGEGVPRRETLSDGTKQGTTEIESTNTKEIRVTKKKRSFTKHS